MCIPLNTDTHLRMYTNRYLHTFILKYLHISIYTHSHLGISMANKYIEREREREIHFRNI